jgi:hypothetical protein
MAWRPATGRCSASTRGGVYSLSELRRGGACGTRAQTRSCVRRPFLRPRGPALFRVCAAVSVVSCVPVPLRGDAAVGLVPQAVAAVQLARWCAPLATPPRPTHALGMRNASATCRRSRRLTSILPLRCGWELLGQLPRQHLGPIYQGVARVQLPRADAGRPSGACWQFSHPSGDLGYCWTPLCFLPA